MEQHACKAEGDSSTLLAREDRSVPSYNNAKLIRTLKITHRCNNRCQFCSDGDFKPEGEHLTTEQVLELFANARVDGIEGITMTGGEPSTRKDLPELIRGAREMGFGEVAIVSNGRRFSYMNYAKEVVEAGLTAITFSIHGHTPELHDHLVRSPGALRQLTQGAQNMKFLKRFHPHLAISSIIVLTRENAPYLEDILATYQSTIEIFLIKYCVPDGFAKDDPSHFMPRYQEIRPHLNDALSYAKANDIRVKLFDVPLCASPDYVEYLEKDERTFEVMTKSGTFQRYAPSQKAHSAKVDVCAECRMQGVCPGVPESYLKLYGYDGAVPFE